MLGLVLGRIEVGAVAAGGPPKQLPEAPFKLLEQPVKGAAACRCRWMRRVVRESWGR